MNLTDYLESQTDLRKECLEDFLPKALQARWEIQGLSVEVFSHIYANLTRVLSGMNPNEMIGLDEHWPFLRSLHLRAKLSYLIELYLSAETCLRDHLLSTQPFDLSLTERSLLFEEVNGGFHALLDYELPACCDGCIAPIRDRFQSVEETGERAHLLDVLSSDEVLRKGDRIIPCPLPDDLPENGNIMLGTFVDQLKLEIVDMWTARTKVPPRSASSIPVNDAATYCYNIVRTCIARDKAHARQLLQEAPHFGRHYALDLCTVGEEALASLLALRSPGGEIWTARARRALNQCFHALLRGLIHAECTRCAKKLIRAAELIPTPEPHMQHNNL